MAVDYWLHRLTERWQKAVEEAIPRENITLDLLLQEGDPTEAMMAEIDKKLAAAAHEADRENLINFKAS